MYRRIMVPLDGSSFAESALPSALELARRSGGSVDLVHVHTPVVVEGVPYTQHDQRWDPESRDREREYLRERARELSSAWSVKVEASLLDGPVFDTLVHHAETTDVELVVMATHGRGGPERIWLGSVADRLVRRSPVPVMLVRAEEDMPADTRAAPGLRRVLVPLDGSALAERALEPAMDLARSTGGWILLVRVIELPESNAPSFVEGMDDERRLRAELEREATAYLGETARDLESRDIATATKVVATMSPVKAVLAAAEEEAVDLIAMATHGRGGVSRWLLGSVADKVVRASPVPVLLIRGVDAD